MSVTVTPLQISSLVVTPLRVGVAPGPNDHGALAGLGGDDHPSYLNEARGDARYAGAVHTHSLADILPRRPTADYLLDIPLLDLSEYGSGEQPGFQYCASSHPIDNGPPGEESYTNHVVSWGWNVKSPSILDDPTQPGFCETIESKFYSGSFGFERQIRIHTVEGEIYRPFDSFFPHIGTGVTLGFKAGLTYWGLETTTTPQVPGVIVAAIRPTATTEAGVGILDIQVPAAGFAHGARALTIGFGANTNRTQVGFLVAGNTNWDVTAQVGNFGSGQAHIDCIVGAAGQFAGLQFIGPSQQWAIGKHTDDSFAVQIGGYGGDVVLAIDKTTRQAAFHAPPKLPGYTVAGLPSAATAGALAYVTDAAGGPTLACSDGTNWRVVAALGAVVS